LNSQCFMVRE